MAKLPEVRPYQRILPSEESIDKLEQEGFEWVFSSNVSGVKAVGNDLYIRFHNGSIYRYDGMGGKFERLMAASSKGKWVWRFLRRAGVDYQKVGTLPLDEDVRVPDTQIVRPQGEYRVSAELPSYEELESGTMPSIKIERIKSIEPIDLYKQIKLVSDEGFGLEVFGLIK